MNSNSFWIGFVLSLGLLSACSKTGHDDDCLDWPDPDR